LKVQLEPLVAVERLAVVHSVLVMFVVVVVVVVVEEWMVLAQVKVSIARAQPLARSSFVVVVVAEERMVLAQVKVSIALAQSSFVVVEVARLSWTISHEEPSPSAGQQP
jgi:hypothetical protein